MADTVDDTIVEDEEVEIPDTLDMSDDDFAKLEGPLEITPEEPPEKTAEEIAEEKAQAETDAEAAKKLEEEEAALPNPLEADDDAKLDDPDKKKDDPVTPVKKEGDDNEDLEKNKELDKEKKTDKKDKEDPEKKEKDKVKPDLSTLTVPNSIKANGLDMEVKTSEDAVRLMQMGANYHKKMAGLKPSLRFVKMLEKANLLDEDKLNFLIDINNKNPEAITKLFKDSAIDPLDVNIKDESDYVPTKHNVNDSEMVLDGVLEDIQDSPTFEKTLDVVSNVWDKSSRNVIAKDPHIIELINEQIADGTYDKITSLVTYQRSLGHLKGVSDIQAYQNAGDQLFKEGKIGQVEKPPEQKPAPIVPPVIKDSEAETKRKAKKAAASPTKGAGTPAAVTYDPLNMSDEEFMKINPDEFKPN